MRFSIFFIFMLFTAFSQAQNSRIAFGSCARQSDPLDIFDTIMTHDPTHFLFLGDNIYADTRDTAEMRLRYSLLDAHPSYQHLKNSVQIWATWDDHDFGENDAGSSYPMKKESAELFYEFFQEPLSSERRTHEGIYTSYIIQDTGLVIQVIMLDTRYFRDELLPYDDRMKKDTCYNYGLNYCPNNSKKSTLLGTEQWLWLEKELEKPADVRLICSSIQFAHSYNGYESWNNFPREKKRFFKLLRKTKANGVMILSGDVHYAEISSIKIPRGYTLFDFTSSGLSSKWHQATPNTNRIAGPVMENNFGMLSFSTGKKGIHVSFDLFTVSNEKVMSKDFELYYLKF
jgi:alkaline phosphatase D